MRGISWHHGIPRMGYGLLSGCRKWHDDGIMCICVRMRRRLDSSRSLFEKHIPRLCGLPDEKRFVSCPPPHRAGNLVMTTGLRARRVAFLALSAFMSLWLGLLILLAQDGCLDNGGALSASGFACLQPDGSFVSLVSFLSPTLAGSVGFLVVLPVVILFRLVLRHDGYFK